MCGGLWRVRSLWTCLQWIHIVSTEQITADPQIPPFGEASHWTPNRTNTNPACVYRAADKLGCSVPVNMLSPSVETTPNNSGFLSFGICLLISTKQTRGRAVRGVKKQTDSRVMSCRLFFINSFRSLAATPYFVFSPQLRIFTGLLFLKSPNMSVPFCTYRFLFLFLFTRNTCGGSVLLPSSGCLHLLVRFLLMWTQMETVFRCVFAQLELSGII